MRASAAARAEVATANGARGFTAAVAAACELDLATLVAVMITEVFLVTLGAVKAPLLEMVPALADQVTAVSAVPLMLAVKCCCPFERMVVLLGEIEILMPELPSETTIRIELEPCRVENPSSFCRGSNCRESDCGESNTQSTELWAPGTGGWRGMEPVSRLRTTPGCKLPSEMLKR